MRQSNARRGVVLVVDDDLDVRDALSALLEEAGYETVSVRDGRMALDYLRAHPAPDAILLDMVMPSMNGFEFWAALRSEAKHSAAPIIIVSADRFVSRRWVDSGVSAFITKPVHSTELLTAVEHAIRTAQGGIPISDAARRAHRVDAT